jgi:hypothetical protein
VGDTYAVSYSVSVQSSLRFGSLTIPNSASIASYATSATTTAATESYFDIRCGEVRLETAGTSSDCKAVSLVENVTAMSTRMSRIKDGIGKAIALRKQYVKAGYCRAADNGCYKCTGRARCINTCRQPSAAEDAALLKRAGELHDTSAQMISSELYTQVSTLDCAGVKTCSMVDISSPANSIEGAGRRITNDTRDILDSCCMRTSRAPAALKQRRASLKQAAKVDLKRLSTLMTEYPNPGLVCR